MTYTCKQQHLLLLPEEVTPTILTYSSTRCKNATLSLRFHQPHPSKRNKKLGQTYCPKSRRCRATKHGLTPGSSSTANCACAQTQMQNMQAACKNPARVAQPAKRPKRNDTMRHDTTSFVHTFSEQHSVPFSCLPSSAIHHLTPGNLASRKPDCAFASTSPICAQWHYYFSTAGCRVGCVKCADSSGWMGFNALADAWRPRACGIADAADQVVHAGLHYMRVYATMHICMQAVGWATSAWRGQSVGSVKFHPNSCAQSSYGDFGAV